MKIKFTESIKSQIDSAITYYSDIREIEYIALTQAEYIQFLEELDGVARVILSLPERKYNGIVIKVLT